MVRTGRSRYNGDTAPAVVGRQFEWRTANDLRAINLGAHLHPCDRSALRLHHVAQATRALSRIYDDALAAVGMNVTQLAMAEKPDKRSWAPARRPACCAPQGDPDVRFRAAAHRQGADLRVRC